MRDRWKTLMRKNSTPTRERWAHAAREQLAQTSPDHLLRFALSCTRAYRGIVQIRPQRGGYTRTATPFVTRASWVHGGLSPCGHGGHGREAACALLLLATDSCRGVFGRGSDDVCGRKRDGRDTGFDAILCSRISLGM